ncbi:heterokaryon incompatibility protein-domain-containing protein, partial [Paraphoma chrysanthemicola]
FEALSYTWGDEKADYPILIDGNVFHVRRNLYCALREIRPTSSSRILWIDAICINQNDVSERSCQVAQMGNVYSFAERVVVWLGESHSLSDLGFDAMTECFQFTDIMCKAAMPGTKSNDTVAEGFAKFLALPNMDNCLFGITAIYIRPWWRRMWTAQEIGLAREIEVQYGSRNISWELLHLFATMMMLVPVHNVLRQYTPHSESGRQAVKLLLARITLRAQSMEDTRKKLGKGKLNLSLLARVTMDRYATDPRDKIYGLLGMMNEGPTLRPDYTLSVSEVYTAATKAMIVQTKDLTVLSFLLDGDLDRLPDLPSWVLDFQNLSKDRRLGALCGFIEDVCERTYSAAPTVGPEVHFTPEFKDADRLLRL